MPSTNDYDWLGHGIYVWENDPERARQWAEQQQGISDPFVVGVVLRLGLCLDLVEVANLNLLQQAYHDLQTAFATLGVDGLPRNKRGFHGDEDLVKRHLDCAVINYLHDYRDTQALAAFDTVRSPFWEGQALYPGGKIMSRTHVQICVRNTTCVVGYFRRLEA